VDSWKNHHGVAINPILIGDGHYPPFRAKQMVILLLSLLLIGALLGFRFHVFILVPAIACALGCVLAVKIACGEAVWLALVQASLASAVLQIGYFCGIVLASNAARGHVLQWRNISVSQRTNR